MATNLSLVASIINNPEAHQVNRVEKMDRTIEVMCDNMEKKINQAANANISDAIQDRGYGHGRKMGD